MLHHSRFTLREYNLLLNLLSATPIINLEESIETQLESSSNVLDDLLLSYCC